LGGSELIHHKESSKTVNAGWGRRRMWARGQEWQKDKPWVQEMLVDASIKRARVRESPPPNEKIRGGLIEIGL